MPGIDTLNVNNQHYTKSLKWFYMKACRLTYFTKQSENDILI